MIDRLIDKAIASLLRTIPGLTVFVGAEDIEPPLQTPWCVVYSIISDSIGRTPVYHCQTNVEYNSISGQDAITAVDQMMTQIDDLLGKSADYSGKPGIDTTGLSYLAWQTIDRSQQQTGDRRKNIRELSVYAALAT